ncbi:MAG: SxtJ family membrane protein [Pseudomonadota bacterium]
MTQPQGFHETLARAGDVKAGSERAFGAVFAVVFLLVALWPLLDGASPRLWALALAALFLAAAVLAPALLAPLNRIWFRFGLLLHRIVSPLAMALLFYLTVTPTALVMRLAGKDPLRLKFDRAAKSYWIERAPPGPAPETMRNQF